MRRTCALVRALFLAAIAAGLVAVPAFASNPIQPAAPAKGGLCAPWNRCLAGGSLALVVLFLAFTGVMYLLQRRGFARIEHRQGHPEGVPVKSDD